VNSNNLRALAKLLRESVQPEHFDMNCFMYDGEADKELDPTDATKENYHTRGTVACAVGHAPLLFPPLPGEDNWAKYSERVFGIQTTSTLWMFMFSGAWAHVDNTPLGAAKRIEYVLDHPKFEPNSSEVCDMMNRRVPLCYEGEG
jgi:hypothetical protein